MLSQAVLDDKRSMEFPNTQGKKRSFSRVDTMVQKIKNKNKRFSWFCSRCCKVPSAFVSSAAAAVASTAVLEVTSAQQAGPAKPASRFRALPWQRRQPLPAPARLPVFIHFCPHAPTLCLHCHIWREEGGRVVEAVGRGYQQRKQGFPEKRKSPRR